jgi:hypothetical protein
MSEDINKRIYACPDGYPSCRKSEAIGEWCKGKCDCAEEIEKRARATIEDE